MLGFGAYFSVVYQPVGVLVLVSDKLAVIVKNEVESSESDDVTNILDFWAVLEMLRVDVDSHKLVELDLSVLNVLLKVEGGVDDFELDNVLFLVLVLKRL